MRYFPILIILECCASIQKPIAQIPSSQPSEPGFVMIDSGMKVPADGFFISVPDTKVWLKNQRIKEINLEEQIAERTLERDNASKQIVKEEWVTRWGIPVTGVLGIVIGVAVGSLFHR